MLVKFNDNEPYRLVIYLPAVCVLRTEIFFTKLATTLTAYSQKYIK